MVESTPKPRRRTCPRCGHKHARTSFIAKSRYCRSCRRRFVLRSRSDSHAVLVNDAFGKYDDQLRECIGGQWVHTLSRLLKAATDAR